MKVLAIVQARMGSSRLPGKVLMQIGNTSVLEFLLQRLSKASSIDEIVVATTDQVQDNDIEGVLRNSQYKFFRGSENDVLNRYLSAALTFKADIVVRITGDCPLVDPQLVDDCVAELLAKDLDYVSNCNNVSNPLPDGFDVEVFTVSSLLLLQKISIIPAYKEHVTFGYFKTGLFSIGSVEYDHNFGDQRVTLDYSEDFEVISEIVDAMGSDCWDWNKIANFLDSHKHITNANSHIVRNASWDISLHPSNTKNNEMLNRDEFIANSSGLLSKRADQFSPGMWPKNYVKAKGQIIWAEENKLYLDYSIGGIGATTLGYAFDFVDNRVISAIKNGSASSINSQLELEASQKLIDVIPWVDSLRFTRSGGEATTLAVRLARAFSGKDTVLFSGYHGWHDWYLSAAFKHKLGNHLLPEIPIAGVPELLADTSHPFEYGDSSNFLEVLNANEDSVGVVILEPMRYSEPDIDFLQLVRDECSSRGIVLIFDEISCGFRFNNSGVHLDIDITPDMVVFSKSLGNGYPIACVGGIKEVMDAAKISFISSTTHTECVGFAAMNAVLDFYGNNDVATDLAERGKAIRDILINTADRYGLEVTTKGLDQLWSWSFNCNDDLNRKLQTIVTESMLRNSILFSNRFYSTLGIDPDMYRLFERAISIAFKKVSKILNDEEDPTNHIEFGLNRLGIY